MQLRNALVLPSKFLGFYSVFPLLEPKGDFAQTAAESGPCGAQKRSENGEITGQSPSPQTVPGRYPISLKLEYKAKSKLGSVDGFGQTRMMSSKDIIFAPGYKLAPGMNAEIVLDWPWLRDGWIHLELVLRVTITSNEDSVIEAQVLAYAFRTTSQS
jgi:hypothetical protein